MNDTIAHSSTARLLVIDDDPAVRLLIGAIFERYGLIVESAADGLTALRRLRRESWGVLIVDLMLPEPNGFEIVRELKSRDRALLGRTIVLTAAEQCMLRDFSDGRLVRRVMEKPFEVSDLVAEVLSCLPDAADAALATPESYVH